MAQLHRMQKTAVSSHGTGLYDKCLVSNVGPRFNLKPLIQSQPPNHSELLHPDYNSDFCNAVVDANQELVKISARIKELRRQKKELQESVVDKIEKRWYPKTYSSKKALEETENRIKQKAIVIQAQLNLDDMDRRDLIQTSTKPITALMEEVEITQDLKNAIRGRSASQIAAALLADSDRHLKQMKHDEERYKIESRQVRATSESRCVKRTTRIEMIDDRMMDHLDSSVSSKLYDVKRELANFSQKAEDLYLDSSKQTAIEIEQLNARVAEAETKLKTEVTRIKKKLQMQITELEMSLDVANKTNIDLQKVIKKQSLQLTELQSAYDELQRQLQQTLDAYGVSQRRVQSLTAEVEEVRCNYDNALRAKKVIELQFEEATTRISELHAVNVNLATSKAKVEQELATIASDYEEITRELRISDERYQKVQVELKHTIETLHEEQERIVKIEAIKKSLEVEVKNLSIRLEEIEANAIAGSRRIISKLEARVRDLELELEEEKRRHAETIKILRKKERTVKEVMIQCEEDQKNISLLQDALEKSSQKVQIYKRQLNEQEGVSQQSVTRVRRFQRELEAAEDRADQAESNLHLIRAKHRTFVTTSNVPGSQVYLVQESRTITE